MAHKHDEDREGHSKHAHEGSHGHNHGGAIGQDGRKLGWSLGIAAAVFAAELIGGILTGSLALQSDAWHVLADVLALAFSWWAVKMTKRRPTAEHTYGYARLGVLAALVNGVSLMALSGYIFYEAIRRFREPVSVATTEMMVIAVLGLLANGAMVAILESGSRNNLNVKSAFLHVVGDTLASVGVILAGVIMAVWHWYLADPLISVAIAALMLRSAYGVARESVRILMESAPPSAPLHEVATAVKTIPGVANVHDIHIWNLSGEIVALSMHAILEPTGSDARSKIDEINRLLAKRFGIFHTTIQAECDCPNKDSLLCSLKGENFDDDAREDHDDHDHGRHRQVL